MSGDRRSPFPGDGGYPPWGGVHCDICDITELYIIVLICAYLLEAGQGSCYLVLFCMDFYYLVLCQGHVRGFP